MNPDKIGKFIYKLRIEKKLSQYQLADMIPITRQAVSKWERGQTIPDSSTLLKLSEIFDVTINELLTGEKEEEKSIEKLEKTTLNILDESNQKTRKIRIILITFILTVLILIITFLFYYFINSYNSIKVYTISSNSDTFIIYDGIFITTKQKTYLKIGTVKGKENIQIENIKLYYKEGKKEVLILEDLDIDRTIIDTYGYDEKFKIKNVKHLLGNTYMEITYNSDQKEIVKLKFKRDFINDSFIFPKKQNITTTESHNNEEKIKGIHEMISYIKENGTKSTDIYEYEIKTDEERIIFRYIENMSIIRKIKNDKIIWSYHEINEIYNCESSAEKITEKECASMIQKDIDTYIKTGGN